MTITLTGIARTGPESFELLVDRNGLPDRFVFRIEPAEPFGLIRWERSLELELAQEFSALRALNKVAGQIALGDEPTLPLELG